MLYLLNFRKHSNQTELDQFFKHQNADKYSQQAITKSAFFKARKNLSEVAFIDLNHQLVDGVYQSGWYYKKWHGFRLCAIDGTSVRLPQEDGLIEHFGLHKGRSDQASCAMGMGSVFYDVLNKVVIDSSINPNHTSEKECAQTHLQFSQQNDLVLFDRGYVAFWLYAYLLKNNISFCMRTKTKQDNVVKAFIKSGQKEAIVTFHPNKPSGKTCQEKELSIKPITLRLIRVELDNEVEVLVTNLMDKEAYDASIFKGLYHLRWGIEENYKRLKQWCEIENFSGKSVLSVKQDFYAKIVASNLSALMEARAQELVDKSTRHLKHSYQVNYAQALAKMKHTIIDLIRQKSSALKALITRTIQYISETKEIVRKGRSYQRRLKNIKNDIHYAPYKSAL